jgi:2-polyprenyl-3-methyl-5-hydroxy-6-metoxy-1,4-benzoquinol methylase
MKEVKKGVSGVTVGEFQCISCGGVLFDVVFTALDSDMGKKPFLITECNSCDLVRTEPVLTDDELNKYYDIQYFGSDKAKFSSLAETLTRFFSYLRARSILSRINRNPLFLHTNSSPKILDIGCGRGNLLKALKQLKCDCCGIERTEFPVDTSLKNIRIYKEKLEDISFAESLFDAVVIWHVLEHVDNPVETLREASRILKPGGIIAIAVPNFGSFQARLFRESWFHLDLPRHRYHFTQHTLLRLLDKNGFKIIRRHTFSLEQNPFGFIQSFFNKMMPSKPNHFYSLLKKTKGSRSILSLALWAMFTVFVIPFAMLEYIVSGVLGKGATLVIYAKKC